MGHRAGLDTVEERIIMPLPGIEPQPSSPHPVTIPTELPRLQQLHYIHFKVVAVLNEKYTLLECYAV
jgi:hypothetical protein